MVSISSTVHFCSHSTNVIVIVLNMLRISTIYGPIQHTCKLSVHSHNDKLFPLTNVDKKMEMKMEEKIIENC